MNRNKLVIPFVVSLTATLGSLYFSEIKGYIPCELCWWQRILMYPIPLLTGLAFLKNEVMLIKKYTLFLSIPGFFISMYHLLLQKTNIFQSLDPCKLGESCSATYINWLGFITIPTLSFTAYTLITLSLLWNNK